jgi:hypothetical protein
VRAKADLADYNVEGWRNRVWKLGRAYPLCPGISDINLFRYSQSVVHLDAEISDRAFDLGVNASFHCTQPWLKLAS